jgi:hypothetical protein
MTPSEHRRLAVDRNEKLIFVSCASCECVSGLHLGVLEEFPG